MEKQFDAKPVLVYLVCDKCGGDMEEKGLANCLPTGYYNLPRGIDEYYNYECKGCGNEIHTSSTYPYVKHVRVEEE